MGGGGGGGGGGSSAPAPGDSGDTGPDDACVQSAPWGFGAKGKGARFSS